MSEETAKMGLTQKQKAKIVEYQRTVIIAKGQLDSFVAGIRSALDIPDDYALNTRTMKWEKQRGKSIDGGKPAQDGNDADGVGGPVRSDVPDNQVES